MEQSAIILVMHVIQGTRSEAVRVDGLQKLGAEHGLVHALVAVGCLHLGQLLFGFNLRKFLAVAHF